MVNDINTLCYIAGILDHRGSFFITKAFDARQNKERLDAVIQIWIYEEKLMDFFVNFFPMKPHKHSKHVSFRGNILDDALRIITPYLKFKKDHANIMIKFRSTFTTKLRTGLIGAPSPTEEEMKIRKNCFEELRKLNELRSL